MAAERGLRADARRNRDALLAAGAKVFLERGPDASLEEIARRAGVGIGTLYRHFPDRDALVLGVYQQQVAELDALSVALLNRLAPVDALHEWMRAFVRYAGIKRGLVGMLKSMMGTATTALDTAKATIRQAAQRLLDAAVADGSIRSDIDATDLLRAMGGVLHGHRPARTDRGQAQTGGSAPRRPPVPAAGRAHRPGPGPTGPGYGVTIAKLGSARR